VKTEVETALHNLMAAVLGDVSPSLREKLLEFHKSGVNLGRSLERERILEMLREEDVGTTGMTAEIKPMNRIADWLESRLGKETE